MESTTDFNAAFIWIVSTLFLLICSSSILFILMFNKKVLRKNKEIQKLEEKRKIDLVNNTLEIQEMERKKLGANLHDDIGPMLSTIKMQINQLGVNASNDEKYTKLGQYLDKTIQDLRGISKNLFPSILQEFGLVEALKDLKDQLNSTNVINVALNISKTLPVFDKNIELSIYRICQEFLNNTIKHANAKNLSILLSNEDNEINLCLSDDGVGIDMEKLKSRKKGIGLKSMELRAKAMNASFDFTSKLGGGSKLLITFNNESNEVRNP